jgi:hypothetical protein
LPDLSAAALESRLLGRSSHRSDSRRCNTSDSSNRFRVRVANVRPRRLEPGGIQMEYRRVEVVCLIVSPVCLGTKRTERDEAGCRRLSCSGRRWHLHRARRAYRREAPWNLIAQRLEGRRPVAAAGCSQPHVGVDQRHQSNLSDSTRRRRIANHWPLWALWPAWPSRPSESVAGSVRSPVMPFKRDWLFRGAA